MTPEAAAELAALAKRLVDWDGIGDADGTRFPNAIPANLAERHAQRREGLDWPARASTMVGLIRLEQFGAAVARCVEDGVPGDIIETGTWRGGACLYARAVLRALGETRRKVWLADSFEGLPPPNPDAFPADAGDTHFRNILLQADLNDVRARFAAEGLLDEQVEFLPGWFQHTLATAPIERLAVLRLDGDMYESTWVALEALYDRVSPGGFVIVDDFGAVEGCRRAVEDFRDRRGITAPLERIDWTGHFWRVPAAGDLWDGQLSPRAAGLLRQAEAMAAQLPKVAESLLGQVLAEAPNALPAHLLLAWLRRPGPDYRHHLARLHARLRPRCYLEIGVGPGDSLALARPETRVVAVDPAPRLPEGFHHPDLRLFETTSDRFLASPEAAAAIGANGFNLAFVDGSHLAEQVVADVLALEPFAAPGAVVVLHDTVPLDAITAARHRTTTFWSGDVWKAVPILQALRPNLQVTTIAAHPTGLTLLRGLDPTASRDAAVETAALAKWHEAMLAQPLSSPLAAGVAASQPMPSQEDSIDRLLDTTPLPDEFCLRFANLAAWEGWRRAHPAVCDPATIAARLACIAATGIVLPGSSSLGGTLTPVACHVPSLREGLEAAGLNSRERAILQVLMELVPATAVVGSLGGGTQGGTCLGVALAARYAAPSQAGAGRPTALVLAERLHREPRPEVLLRQAQALLPPGGLLVASFPFDHASPADTLCGSVAPDFSIRPGTAGTCWRPGWTMPGRCRAAGFAEAEMWLLGSLRHGILDDHLAGIFLLVARR